MDRTNLERFGIVKRMDIQENGVQMVFGITKDEELKLLHFSNTSFCEDDLCKEELFM